MAVQFVPPAHDQPPDRVAFGPAIPPARDGVVVASTFRAVRAACSVSQYAYAPTAAAPAIGTQRLTEVPAMRCATFLPSVWRMEVRACDDSCRTIARSPAR